MDPSCVKAILKSRLNIGENDGVSNVSLNTETNSSDDEDRESASLCKKVFVSQWLGLFEFSFADSMGIKSPTAMRGRSVKEFEEQLTNLRKENFNLKLRIYFLEERMGTGYNLDKESAVKKNIELMVSNNTFTNGKMFLKINNRLSNLKKIYIIRNVSGN